MYSPAETDGAAPSTVTRSFCPRTLTRKTQNPLSGLWKVTRSTRPDRGSRSSAELNRGFPLGAPGQIFQTRDVRPLTGRARPPAHYSGPSLDERRSADVGESGLRSCARSLFALCQGTMEPRVLNRSAPAACATADHVSGAIHGSWLRVASRAARHIARPTLARASSARRFRHCAEQDAGPDRLSSRRRFDIHLCRNYRERKRSIPWNPFRLERSLSMSVRLRDGTLSTQPDSRDTGIQG